MIDEEQGKMEKLILSIVQLAEENGWAGNGSAVVFLRNQILQMTNVIDENSRTVHRMRESAKKETADLEKSHKKALARVKSGLVAQERKNCDERIHAAKATILQSVIETLSDL